MTDFKRVSAGQLLTDSPAFSAGWCNAVSDAAEHHQLRVANGEVLGNGRGLRENDGRCTVRNLTGSDLSRGHYVQLGNYLLTSVDARKPWFQGNLYSASASNRIAILLQAVKNNETGEAALADRCTALVNVTDTAHQFAIPADGLSVLESAAEGAIEILSPLIATGGQEVVVIINGTTSGLQRGITAGPALSAIAWDNTDNTYTSNCIEVYRLVVPPLWLPNTSYATNEWITRVEDEWAATTAYAVGDFVREGGELWECNEAHTSGTSRDTHDSKWDVQGCGALGRLYRANIAFTSGATFVVANWTLKDGYEYIDRSEKVKWRNDIIGAVQSGHLVKAVGGNLVFYDCDQLPGWVDA